MARRSSAVAIGPKIISEIPAEDLPPRCDARHRIAASIADLCNMRFYALSDAAGARLNSGTQLRDIALAHLPGDRHREHAVLAGFREVAQMRFHAGHEPALAGLNVCAQFLDVASAGLARLLCYRGRS